MLESGEVIGGRYRLLAPLASGGMGAVWRAEHTELKTEVALKVMLAGAVGNASSERRFRREAQAAARLSSPHVVRVHDFGLHEGRPYLAMELLHGEDLQARIAARGPLPLDACAKILDGVACAIDLAHEAGITHRDLKPANIFLTSDGETEVVKVLDFGVAKVEGPDATKTTGSGLVGSPAYMSPEQVWGEPVTPSTDVWSLGVVAFEMVTGKNPFEGGALAKVFERIVRDDLPRVGDHLSSTAPALDGFFQKAFAREPSERFSNASELSSAFRNALVAPPAQVTARPSRRWAWAIAPALAALAVIGLLAAQSSSAGIGPTPDAMQPTAAMEVPPPASSSTTEPIASASPMTSQSMTAAAPSSSTSPAEQRKPPIAAGTRASAIPRASATTTSSAVDPIFGIPEHKH
ncbi:MAG: protein kinase [Polyangiaceae bacterium]|nr:protein kinase [Polyangiaceae bacterium]